MALKLPAINQDAGSLKARIKELEAERLSLKNKLEDLRKAQNSVIVKKQTEVVNLTGPQLGVKGQDKGEPGSQGPQVIYQDVGENPELAKELEEKNEKLREEIKAAREFLDSHNTENSVRDQLVAELTKYNEQIAVLKKDNEKARKSLAMMTH